MEDENAFSEICAAGQRRRSGTARQKRSTNLIDFDKDHAGALTGAGPSHGHRRAILRPMKQH